MFRKIILCVILISGGKMRWIKNKYTNSWTKSTIYNRNGNLLKWIESLFSSEKQKHAYANSNFRVQISYTRHKGGGTVQQNTKMHLKFYFRVQIFKLKWKRDMCKVRVQLKLHFREKKSCIGTYIFWGILTNHTRLTLTNFQG